MAALLINILHIAFTVYTLMLIIRVVGSWFPSSRNHSFWIFIGRCIDPYLDIFRRLIPPIGGILDLSPMLGFFGLQLLYWICIKIILILSH